MTGLNHRFDKDLLFEWLFWQRCLWCGENRWDAMHHVISPSSRDYQKTNANKSILNGCPIHNEECHLKNSQLHKRENEIDLLQKIIDIMVTKDYQFNKIDKQFIKTYWKSHYQYITLPSELCQTISGSTQGLMEESP